MISTTYAECFIGEKGIRVPVMKDDEDRAMQLACNNLALQESAFLKENVNALKSRCDCEIITIMHDPGDDPRRNVTRTLP